VRHARLIFLLALLAIVVWAASVLGKEPEGQTIFPKRPALGFVPEGATQYVGLAADGSRVAVRRNGSWLWMRVDIASTTECLLQIGPDLTKGLTVYEGDDDVRSDRFEVAHQVERPLQSTRWVNGSEVTVGVQWIIDARASARFEGGRVRGRYTRRDDLIVQAGDDLGCERTIEFDIPQSTYVPPRPR
jgi:hypothetical protein